MEFRDYLALVRRHWLVILICAVVGAAGAGSASLLVQPTYSAKSQLFVSVGGSDSVTDLAQGNSFSERRVASYVKLATSTRVLEPVIRELDLTVSASTLAGMLTVSTPSQTVLIDIAADDHDPDTARRIADAVAAQLKDTVTEVESGDSASGGAGITISVVEDATTPTVPVSPSIKRNTGLGFAGGALLGFAIALARKVLDTRIRSRDDVAELTDASVLGAIALEPGLDKRPLAILTDPYGTRAEAFRQLRTHLQFTNLDNSSQSLVVTSSIPGEGKSSTSINLALIMAEGGMRVLLVDADLRRPRVADYLSLEGSVGLSTVLAGRIEFADAVQRMGGHDSLDVLTSGAIPPNPSELLGSAAMRRLLEEWKGQYDAVVFDAPPTGPVTDPAVLGSLASGVLMVASVDGRVHRDQLEFALETFDAVEARMLGLVLNRVPVKKRGYGYGGYGATYEYAPLEEAQPRMRPRNKRDRRVRKSTTAVQHAAEARKAAGVGPMRSRS